MRVGTVRSIEVSRQGIIVVQSMMSMMYLQPGTVLFFTPGLLNS